MKCDHDCNEGQLRLNKTMLDQLCETSKALIMSLDGQFKTPGLSVSDMFLCSTHWGRFCMRVLIVLEGKKYLFI